MHIYSDMHGILYIILYIITDLFPKTKLINIYNIIIFYLKTSFELPALYLLLFKHVILVHFSFLLK